MRREQILSNNLIPRIKEEGNILSCANLNGKRVGKGKRKSKKWPKMTSYHLIRKVQVIICCPLLKTFKLLPPENFFFSPLNEFLRKIQ